MAEIIKIHESEQLEVVHGVIYEDTITNTVGIKTKIDFGSNTKTISKSVAGLRVLQVSLYDSVRWDAWFTTNGAIVSPYMVDTTFLALSNDTIMIDYDVVLFDSAMWDVTATLIAKGKELVDLGMIVCASGNDTTTNIFVLAVAPIGTEVAYRGITMPNSTQSVYTLKEPNTDIGSMGTDPGIYISSLNPLCTPLYYHSDVGENAIMGYIYESESGGSFYFDQSGYCHLYFIETMANIVNYQVSKRFSFKNSINSIRYIRDYVNGSDVNKDNHWCEIEVIDINGVNRALGIIPTSNDNFLRYPELITDGVKKTSPYASTYGDYTPHYVQIDLGDLYSIKETKVWHYYNLGRTYNDSRTQVSKDGVYWVDIFNSANEGIYSEPLPETQPDGITSVGKGKTTNLLEVNNNISRVDYGMPIEDSFENLADTTTGAYGRILSSAPWGGIEVTASEYIKDSTPHGYIDVTHAAWDFDETITTGSGIRYTTSSITTIEPSTKYTISLFIKPINTTSLPHANWIYLRYYNSVASQTTTSGQASSSRMEELSNGWYRFWTTIESAADVTGVQVDSYDYSRWDGVDIKTYGLQIVKVDTIAPIYEFNLGIKNKSYYELEVPGTFTSGTIIGKFIPRTAWTDDATYSSTASQSALLRLQDDTNGGGAYFRYFVSSGLSIPFLDIDDDWGSVHINQIYTIDANIEITYIIIKNAETLSITLFQDNVQKPTHTYNSISADAEINRIIFGSDVIWNGTHTDLVIYDEVLSLTDVATSLKTKMSLKDSGDIYVNKLSEIGENLWENQDFETTTYGINGSSGTITLEKDEYGTYHQMSLSNDTNTYKGYDITTVSGEVYIFSGWFWKSIGNTFNYSPCVIEYGTGLQTTTWGEYPDGEWFFTWSSVSASVIARCLIYPSYSTACSGIVKWRNMCVRKATPDEIKLMNDGTFQAGDITEI